MIFCSYYGNVKKIMENYGRDESSFLSISLGRCRDLDIKEVKEVLVDRSDFLNFKYGDMDWKEYCLNYYNKLNNLSDDYWVKFFEKCNEKILLCYEKDVRECHRYLLGKFLYWKFGKCKLVEIDNCLRLYKIEKGLVEV